MSTFYLFPGGRTPGLGDGYPVDEFQCPPFIFFLEGGHQEMVMDIQWLSSNAHLLFFFLEGGHQEEVMDIQWRSSNAHLLSFSQGEHTRRW
jgi:hypothetical protein